MLPPRDWPDYPYRFLLPRLEVTRRFWAAGGRVFDTSPLYGMAARVDLFAN
jgi:hypothetical protein